MYTWKKKKWPFCLPYFFSPHIFLLVLGQSPPPQKKKKNQQQQNIIGVNFPFNEQGYNFSGGGG